MIDDVIVSVAATVGVSFVVLVIAFLLLAIGAVVVDLVSDERAHARLRRIQMDEARQAARVRHPSTTGRHLRAVSRDGHK